MDKQQISQEDKNLLEEIASPIGRLAAMKGTFNDEDCTFLVDVFQLPSSDYYIKPIAVLLNEETLQSCKDSDGKGVGS